MISKQEAKPAKPIPTTIAAETTAEQIDNHCLCQ